MRVLRISPVATTSDKVIDLLRQALGEPVTVDTVYPDPSVVEMIIGQGSFGAVLIQSVPPESRARIEEACRHLLVLRPVYTEERTSRGEHVYRIDRFATV